MCRINLDVFNIFGKDFLNSIGITNNVLFSDLNAVDEVWKKAKTNVFTYPERGDDNLWQSLEEMPTYVAVEAKTLDTKFRPNAKANMDLAFPVRVRENEDRSLENFRCTERVRQQASGALKPKTLQQLRSRLRSMYDIHGVHKREDKFIYINRDFAKKQPLKLLDVNGENMCFFDATLPDPERRSLNASLVAIMDAHNISLTKSFDSKKEGIQHCVTALHFSTYNRMHMDGSEAPSGAYPFATAHYEAHGDEFHLNYSQLSPYMARELKENTPLYNSFLESCTDIFNWVSETVLLNCPDEVESLELVLEELPVSGSSPFHPWASLVVNFKVITRAHRDYHDNNLCGVLALGNFVGGELVLYEQGLVIPLQSGDLVIFPSHRTTHFNLHAVGSRASFVFTTDQELDSWALNNNGFDGSIIMNGAN
ncbi:hypothetical protein EVG20_g11213 [Dentipellis fragilis]|uniref:Uncharacterized protein n=1 Tax=Dentipellis fragilis TaxID=205917 RepID=A0A4Y9XR42_9AGAM|nr:hypothetical protein EVG20_g11213 [Dentipellis fragilis]